jgi:DNA-binding CsgD family transcriptional regulator
MPSSVLVGRRAELLALTAAVDRARRGQGGVAIVVGEAGIGKTRLLTEVAGWARRNGLVTLRGRAVDGGGTYRPLSEALVGAFGDAALAQRADLRPYRAALGRLIPGWARPGDAPGTAVDPTVVLGEGLLRLLGRHAGVGCLVVLDDLHWADAETCALVEYLAAAACRWPVLVAVSARDEPPAAARLGRIARLDGVTALHLSRLTPAEVGELAEHCGHGQLSTELREFLIDRSDGLPFLVEELIAGIVEADASGSPPASVLGVPPTLAGLVDQRLARLTPGHRRVVEAAAVMGTDPEVAILAEVLRLAEPAVADALESAVHAQLLVSAGTRMAWRHALTRDAVLATVVAARRAVVAGAAAATLRRRGSPGDELRAAELLAAGGDTDGSGRIFLRLARRELAGGSLRSAEDLLARSAAVPGLCTAVAVERIRLLALKGEPVTALEVGAAAVEDAVGSEHAELCLRLAEAALAAGRWAEADGYVDRAGRPEDPRSALLLAHAAFGAGDLERATRLATGAVDRATGPAAEAGVLCAALTVLGRCEMRRDPAVARAVFGRAAQIAAEHGLRPLRVPALMGIGTLDLYDVGGRCGVLDETRELALDTGMLAVVISIDLMKIYQTVFVDGPQVAATAAAANAEQAGRLRLHRSQAMAELFVAAGAGIDGDGVGMERLIQVATARRHGSVEVLAGGPFVRAVRFLVRHDVLGAAGMLDRSVAALGADVAGAPGPVWGLWVLVGTLLDERCYQTRARLVEVPAVPMAANRGALEYAAAVLAGRSGRRGDAQAWFARADRTMAELHWWRRLLRQLTLEAALADGWGDPVPALRADLEAFERTGAEQLARTCRDLLRRAGAPTRRGRGRTPVPAWLRGAGVTAREMDVLALVAEGLSNREIAQRLFLSPRTVETHVSNLLAKTGLASRPQLRAIDLTP